MTQYVPVPAEVLAVRRVSASFIRVTFGGAGLARCGSPYPVLDQRIKLIFTESGSLPPMSGDDEWYREWLALPAEDRGAMRTYSIREQRLTPASTEYDVDFVLHGIDGTGHSGPATTWAAQAAPGDKLMMVAPAREGNAAKDNAGIAFQPGSARTVWLVGDETALPAIARILGDRAAAPQGSPLSAIMRGHVVIEVPTPSDAASLPLPLPSGFDVSWCIRDGQHYGDALHEALIRALEGTHRVALPLTEADVGASSSYKDTVPVEANGLVWEQPEAVTAEEYWWIAGESSMVRRTRRMLLADYHYERSQIAFMGYWRNNYPA